MNSTDSSNYHNETIIETASFKKDVIIRYQMWSAVIVFGCTIAGIPLLLLVIPLILLIWPRVVNTWKCVLTNRAVHVEKGLFVKVKKTIPLEKITDVGSVQGPIMRHFDLHSLSFETAGQSGGAAGALVTLLGIENSEAFRERVLDTRDASNKGAAPAEEKPPPASDDQLLREIRDSLIRIEERLGQSG